MVSLICMSTGIQVGQSTAHTRQHMRNMIPLRDVLCLGYVWRLLDICSTHPLGFRCAVSNNHNLGGCARNTRCCAQWPRWTALPIPVTLPPSLIRSSSISQYIYKYRQLVSLKPSYKTNSRPFVGYTGKSTNCSIQGESIISKNKKLISKNKKVISENKK